MVFAKRNIVVGVCTCVLALAAASVSGQSSPAKGQAVPLDQNKDIVIKRTAAKPIIDGKLDDVAWQGQTALEHFTLNASYAHKLAKKQTKVYLTFDDENLYVGIECEEPSMAGIQADMKEDVRDYPYLWKDDCVEVFVHPGKGAYYQFLLTVNNMLLDIMCDYQQLGEFDEDVQVEFEYSWNCSGFKSKVHKDENYWSVEMSIPFSEMGGAPGLNDEWGVNITREEKQLKELSTFSPLFGMFHQPAAFSRITFQKNKAIVVRPQRKVVPLAQAIIKDGPSFVGFKYSKKYPAICVTGQDDFIFNQTLYVSPDHIVPRGVTYRLTKPIDDPEVKALNIRLVYELPEGVEVVGLTQPYNLSTDSTVYPQVTEFKRSGKTWKRYSLPLNYIQNRPMDTSIHMVYFKSTLAAGSVTECNYYLTWTGGQQPPRAIRIESITIPKVKPPKKFFIGLWGLWAGDLKLMCPDFPNDFSSLGINTIPLYYRANLPENSPILKKEYEFGDDLYQKARENGIFIFYNQFFPITRSAQSVWDWTKYDEDARAMDIHGQPVMSAGGPVVCPSYRGRLYTAALERIKTSSQLKRWPASYFSMDLEIYGDLGTKVCFCKRCVRLFKEWFVQRYPNLLYIDPFTLNREVKRSLKDHVVSTRYPGQYQAWVDFKTEQVADMWKGMKETLAEVVGSVRTMPFEEVTLADWAGIYDIALQQEGDLYGLYTARNAFSIFATGAYAPAGLLQQKRWGEQLERYYSKQYKMRRSLYATPAVASMGWAWAQVRFATKPERSAYYLLETAVRGVQGVLLWHCHLGGYEGKQMAINARIFDSFRLVDDIITEGERLHDLKVTGKDMHASGLAIGNERLVLVGDHYVATDRREAVLTCPVKEKSAVYDLLTREKLGELEPGKEQITLVIDKLDDRARFLYIGNNWEQRLQR